MVAHPQAARMLFMLTSVLITGLLAGCTPGPEPIDYGHEACTYCRMTITDPRYATELVNSTGKVYPFDAVECLVAYLNEHPEAEVHSLWVNDFADPGTLIPIPEAVFLHSGALHSPMGLNIAAFGSGEARQAVQDSLGGTPLRWDAVQERVHLSENGMPALLSQ